MNARTLRSVALRMLVLAIACAGLVFAARGVSLADVAKVLRAASGEPVIALCPLLLVAGTLLRAARFQAVLGDARAKGPGAGFREVLLSIVVTQAANNVLPLHAGDLVRTRHFVRFGYAITAVALAQLGEKLVEGVTLGAWVFPLVLSDERYRVATKLFALTLGAVVVVALTAAVLLRRTLLRPRIDAFLQRVAAAARNAHLALAVALAVVADAVEVALVWVCLRGVGVSSGLTLSLAVFGAVNIATLAPATPGNIGTQEASSALVLIAAGLPRDTALGFAVLYRVVQWVPVTLAGFVAWLGRDRRIIAEQP